MYVCIYVHLCALCIHTYIHIHTHPLMHACTYINGNIHIPTYICTHIPTCICTYIHMYKHTCICILPTCYLKHANIHTYISYIHNMNIQICIHTYKNMHTCTHSHTCSVIHGSIHTYVLYIHTYVCTYVLTYICTYIYAYIHT